VAVEQLVFFPSQTNPQTCLSSPSTFQFALLHVEKLSCRIAVSHLHVEAKHKTTQKNAATLLSSSPYINK
jgi:hypothetical protein